MACKPILHELPNGSPVKFTMEGWMCNQCGHVDQDDGSQKYGFAGPHVTRPSGVYRQIFVLPKHTCSACGFTGDAIAIPCEDSELFMKRNADAIIEQDAPVGVPVHEPTLRS